MARTPETAMGWGWPGLSRKAHIFNDSSTSLCRKWLFTGRLDQFVLTDKPGPDDCRACWKRALNLGTNNASRG